jgi:hypothetical protein
MVCGGSTETIATCCPAVHLQAGRLAGYWRPTVHGMVRVRVMRCGVGLAAVVRVLHATCCWLRSCGCEAARMSAALRAYTVRQIWG